MSISIVMPFYKRAEQLFTAIEFNFNHMLGHEIVLVMDEPTEEEKVRRIIQCYPELFWKVIINRNDHPWRNPAKAINVGIRNACGDRVMVMSPESIMVTNVPAELSAKMDGNNFTVGHVAFISYRDIKRDGLMEVFEHEHGTTNHFMFGSIMAERAALCSVRGYDEANTSWGVDDCNIRARLAMEGQSLLFVNEARMIHPSLDRRTSIEPKCGTHKSKEEIARLKHPTSAIANDEQWGTEFNERIL